MAHLEIGTFGESQGDIPHMSNYLEDGAKGLQRLYRLGWVKRLDLDLFWVELNPLILTCISEF